MEGEVFMITDYADKLHLYGDLQEYADMVLAFIEKQKKENLPAGRYDLENGVFASVQSYTTRPLEGSQMESHKKYCDLQYLIEGKEKIYWDSILYVAGPWQGYTVLEPGMFGFYAPDDGHMPGVAADEPAPAKKIVFKIPVK